MIHPASRPILLGVNIDHVATLREVRHTAYPDPLDAAFAAKRGGADGITVHLREDRRHIQEHDVERIRQTIPLNLNFEMAVTDEMVRYAETIKPAHCCFVPEKRHELTTEGGLDVIALQSRITEAVKALKRIDIAVSLFIDPDLAQIEAALKTGASTIEIHTGAYADATASAQQKELQQIIQAAAFAHQAGLIVNAGHGLHYENVQVIAAIPEINELNIGHSIVARAIFIGLEEAVRTMKQHMIKARNASP